jgi:hypothetical protein
MALAQPGSTFTDGLYAGAPGQAFSRAWPLSKYSQTQAVDGCGRLVGLANTSPGQANDALLVEALSDAPVPITLGNLPVTVAVAAMPGGFVVVWFEWAGIDPAARAPLPLKMATLSWQ